MADTFLITVTKYKINRNMFFGRYARFTSEIKNAALPRRVA